MYKSVIREGKFLVLIADGVFDSPIMELPTEELADKVAFELQAAWDEGELWGANQMRQKLDSKLANKETSEEFKKIKAMSPVEREDYYKKNQRRREKAQRIESAKRWKSVLSWKNSDGK